MNLSEKAGEEPAEPLPDYVKTEKKQGEFTPEDYFALPNNGICMSELIDGVIYSISNPDIIHRMIAAELSYHLNKAITECDINWLASAIPVNVWLNPKENTILQPDLCVICDSKKLQGEAVCGAPDMVVEILSKHTRKKDMTIKLQKYSEGGVKEYWMVDPVQAKVIVYLFEGEERQVVYDFQDEIPIGFIQGKKSIPFSEVYRGIRFAYKDGGWI